MTSPRGENVSYFKINSWEIEIIGNCIQNKELLKQVNKFGKIKDRYLYQLKNYAISNYSVFYWNIVNIKKDDGSSRLLITIGKTASLDSEKQFHEFIPECKWDDDGWGAYIWAKNKIDEIAEDNRTQNF